MHGKILVYGDNPLLLATRHSLLTNAGYSVHTTTEFADAMLMIMSRQVSVLLLCQSMQSEEWSGSLKFVILSSAGHEAPVEYAEIVEELEEPNALLSMIRGILASQAIPESLFLN
jgi:CheY-like chemotaxis protein